MGHRWNAESVENFVIFLLILPNCGEARTLPEIQQKLHQRRDGLAKFEFSAALPGRDTISGSNQNVAPAEPLYVFNFTKIDETLCAQRMQPTTGDQQQHRGRDLRNPQVQPLRKKGTTQKPFHVVEQLNLDLEEKLLHWTTAKPFSPLQQLTAEQVKQLRRKTANNSFNILESLQMEQERHASQFTTMKPFHVFEELDVQDHESGFEILQSVAAELDEPLEEHKSLPAESSRAKDSQKRKRKRIRRRRKRIRRRRKRKRKKKRKKKKKKKKKKKNKKEKGQKKKKRRKTKKKKPEINHVIGQPAQLIYANPVKQPYHPHHSYYPHPQQQQQANPTTIIQVLTTKRPATTKAPFSKIKYLLRHNALFKKKKKEWVNHVGHVIYPFIKFVAFFTVLNPFTLGVFLFTLISPVVFGFLGFVALSLLVKPFLHIVFGIKSSVDNIDRQHLLANKRAEQLKLNLRPVTIHKHFYQQRPLHSSPPRHLPPLVDWRRQSTSHLQQMRHNPLLPEQRAALELL
ncbi:uncharacterized protein LOC6558135 [Drosophila grimshawi]|uniref:GH16583 n=1 Tax=Drosophila grimshawi TaxID=7222 RepID=B4J238_DROGR|nr:uncharacterized protein LOC6558135 [Drosophila grimshawi]EDV96989.1 GH16583 [Drosophila grimshawi]